MSAYFITASGTEVGKTFATCALIHAARSKGLFVNACKPIISGFNEESFDETDTAKIMTALGMPTNDFNALETISPLRFKAPISPNMAAEREGKTIDFLSLVDWSKRQIRSNEKASTLTLIEGIGGAMVPINNTHTVREWIAALSIQAMVVAGSYVGSISHTLTTLEALRAMRIEIAALIVSESTDSPVTPHETLETLAYFTDDIPLRIAQPRVSSATQATDVHALLEQLP